MLMADSVEHGVRQLAIGFFLAMNSLTANRKLKSGSKTTSCEKISDLAVKYIVRYLLTG